MQAVNVAKLKNQLSKYLAAVKRGEEIVIRERNLPIAKLIPFDPDDADAQELRLVAEGKMKLPTARVDVDEILKIPTAKLARNKAIQALLANRDEE